MGSPTSRRLLLLSLLQTRRDWAGEELAVRLQISPRTVRRDVDQLRVMGYRITALKGPDGGYRLTPGETIPPMLFDEDQAVAVAAALQVTAATQPGLSESAERALHTMRQLLPSRLRGHVDSLYTQAVAAAGAPTPVVEPKKLSAVAAAVNSRQILRFDYRSGTNVVMAHRAEAHHLLVSAGRWYLLGWQTQKQQWRIYRVDRMTPRLPAGPRAPHREVPGGNPALYAAARFRGQDREQSAASKSARWSCQGSAVLGLPIEQVAPFIGDGTAEPVDESSSRVVLGSWSWVSLAASLARFDTSITEVVPGQLREAFTLLAGRFTDAGAMDSG